MDVRLPDGSVIRGVPEGTTKEQILAKLQANGIEMPKEATGLQKAAGAVRDFGAGAVRGAGSIGATLLAPIDIASDAIAGKGLSLESNRQRRTDMDSALADITGADTDSLAYGAGKLGTEVLGTLGAGGAVANTVARVAPRAAAAAPQFMNAVRSGGFSTGQRALPGAVNTLKDVGIRAAGGATSGAASAALVNPEDVGIGAVVGGALPVAAKIAGAAGRTVGNAISPRMAANNATGKIVAQLGDDVPQTVADLQTYYPKGAENIPASAAAITQNPALARLEQGSRLRATEPWYNFDQTQGNAVFQNVMKGTDEAAELGQRMKDRSEAWNAAWTKAEDNFKPRLWNQRMTQFGADMETAMRSSQSSNPAVRSVLEAINAEMDRLGPNFSIGNLQQLRANLNGKIQPNSPDVFKSAPRDNPAIISLKQEMDDILNTVTGGKWQKVIEGYAGDSTKVHAAKAAQKVRNAFMDPETGRIQGVALNPDTPKITEAGLGRAMNAARMPDKSLALSPEANDTLEATLGVLQRQGVVQGVKRAATAGGGSDTVPNAIASGATGGGMAPNMLMQFIGAMRRLGTAKTDNEMARLLSDPDALVAELSRWMQPPVENRLVSTAARSAPAIAADR
jgi:hypothetical protein